MEPIVPERGERIGKRDAPQSRTPPPKQKSPAPSGKSPSGAFVKSLLFVILIAYGGLGFVVYQQNLRLAGLSQQFNELQGKISSTDESLSQSGAALSVRIKDLGETLKAHEQKLELHFSEIDKLWAARNSNKKAVEDSEKAVDALKKELASTKKSLDSAIAEARQAKTAVLGSQAEVAEVADRINGILAQVQQSEKAMKQWQVKTNDRLGNTEEAIRAIDAFRISVNQQLLALKAQIGATAP